MGGMVKSIRGVAYSIGVSPQNSNRMVDGARSVLNNYLSDVFIFTDHVSGNGEGKSPGFGITIVAETTMGCLFTAEGLASAYGKTELVPEDIGRKAAWSLLREIHRGGVVDSTHQNLLITLCALGANELHQVRLGQLTKTTLGTLRLIEEVFGIKFCLWPEHHGRF